MNRLGNRLNQLSGRINVSSHRRRAWSYCKLKGGVLGKAKATTAVAISGLLVVA